MDQSEDVVLSVVECVGEEFLYLPIDGQTTGKSGNKPLIIALNLNRGELDMPNYNLKMSVVIDYTNYKGERSLRKIIPFGIDFTSNQWHPKEQHMLFALDIEKDKTRFFPMKNIHSWTPEEEI